MQSFSLLLQQSSFFVGLFFWPLILNNIIKPTALVVWLLLRLLVLSIDQKYFWSLIIFVGVFFLFRLLPQEQPTVEPETILETNATLKSIRNWHNLFTFTDQNIRDHKTLKRELKHLLTSIYTARQSALNRFGVSDALQAGEIPLPEHIYTILFSEEPQKPGGSIKKFLQFLRGTPQKWIRRWTGQEESEHYQMIDEILCFMENSLETKK